MDGLYEILGNDDTEGLSLMLGAAEIDGLLLRLGTDDTEGLLLMLGATEIDGLLLTLGKTLGKTLGNPGTPGAPFCPPKQSLTWGKASSASALPYFELLDVVLVLFFVPMAVFDSSVHPEIPSR
eukprot:CAMPEP_0178966166 /NCGR_PEP_ID=MMETSP0789-20121207/16760_1 /TAXON_ID=3005 /ORGANISM="Rhizosolenia setigera, Strain CCMP 1694" /LENGTH=123 /DNA_ID=CAMNT_0020651379 /DNA_START=248 /DNA_END=619 /DNA_ORIENTATION=-